ncbi:MAG: hypothetical protein WCH82_11115 [Mycobacteriaceae bacterium]
MPVAIAGVGGLILGHIVWLLGISLARAAPSAVSTWVLAVSVVFLLGAAAAISQARQLYERRELTRAAFLAGLSVSPVLLTLVVLGVTYL